MLAVLAEDMSSPLVSLCSDVQYTYNVISSGTGPQQVTYPVQSPVNTGVLAVGRVLLLVAEAVSGARYL